MARGGLYGNVQLRRGLLLGHRLFCLGSQVNAALLADNLIMPVDVVNQFSGGLVDGLQTGTQLGSVLSWLQVAI